MTILEYIENDIKKLKTDRNFNDLKSANLSNDNLKRVLSIEKQVEQSLNRLKSLIKAQYEYNNSELIEICNDLGETIGVGITEEDYNMSIFDLVGEDKNA